MSFNPLSSNQLPAASSLVPAQAAASSTQSRKRNSAGVVVDAIANTTLPALTSLIRSVRRRVELASSPAPNTNAVHPLSSLLAPMAVDSVPSPLETFIRNAAYIHENKRLWIGGVSHTLTKLESEEGLNYFSYSLCEPGQSFPGEDNSYIRFIVPKPELLRNGDTLQKTLEHQRETNIDCQLVGIRTAPILNLPTMMQNGYVTIATTRSLCDFTKPVNLLAAKLALRNCYIHDIPSRVHNGFKSGHLNSNFRLSSPRGGQPVLVDLMGYDEDAFEPGENRFAHALSYLPGTFDVGDVTNDNTINYLDPRILDIEWDKNTQLPNLTPENLKTLVTTMRELKRLFRNLVIEGTKTIEDARSEFLGRVQMAQNRLGLQGLSLNTLYNLYEFRVKSNPLITKARLRNGEIAKIEGLQNRLAIIANENPYVFKVLTD